MEKLLYKDWFINQKRVPDKESKEFETFYNYHKTLALDGFMMEDEFINPFLYWHLNFWHTEVDIMDEKGRIYQKYANPYLRDNEWLTTTEIHKANLEKKGLVIGGIRRFAKSVLESSYIGWGATFDANSQNIVSGLNAADIKLITDKIDKGLNFLPEAWRWQRIEDNWKNQVTLGVKTKGGERIPFSSILIRNLDDGNNEEAIAGTKPRKLIIDEGGKGPFLRGLQAAIPGFTTPFGWCCSPIITFTGGDMKKFMDARMLMFDVDAFNFMSYQNDKDDKRFHGLFIGHKYRLEAKEDSTLGAYLDKPQNSVLRMIPMQVSNAEIAEKVTNDNLARAKKAGDRVAYLKEKMYYPKDVDDIFLNEDTNIFDIEAARIQKTRISINKITGVFVELYHDGERVTHRFSDKLPINNFPSKPGDNKDAPIVIYEFPIENPPYGLYTIGVDPYKQGKAMYSNSLGVLYVYKRMHEINSELYQDVLVAVYAARPEAQAQWNEQARLLCKFYNARVLCENDEMSFINYMIAKGDSHLLEIQPQWIREIIPNTTVNRDYGISRSADKMRTFLHGCLKKYLEEVVNIERDAEGSIIAEKTGVTRVLDPMLLEEIIQFSEEEGNYDRIVAAELAISQALKMDPIIGKINSQDDPRVTALFKGGIKGSKLFNRPSNLFKQPRKNIFTKWL
jgi:hypothetical protein